MVRPVMRHAMSMQSRLFASLLSAALIVGPMHVANAAPSLEDLYTQGQEAFDAGDYGTAGDKWAEAVRGAEENEDNSATRQTIMNLALDAYLRGYRADDDRTHIDKAKALLDEYEASLDATGAALTPEISSEKGKIEDILSDLAAAAAEADKPDEIETDTKPDTAPPPVILDDKPGQPLIIAGAVLSGVGVIGAGILLTGVIGGLGAQADFEAAEVDSPARDSARTRGKTMNALAITGAIVTPVFLGTGIALIVVGAKRNKEARRSNMMLVPEFGPTYAGFGLSGSF